MNSSEVLQNCTETDEDRDLPPKTSKNFRLRKKKIKIYADSFGGGLVNF